MNKIPFFLSVIVSILLTSCQFSESLYINEDNTGKVSLNFDGSELLAQGSNMIGAQKKSGGKPIDTLVVYKDFLREKKDSIAKLPIKDQERLKKLENFKMHVVLNEVDKKMKIDMFSQFDKVAELEDVFNTFQIASTDAMPFDTSNMTARGGDDLSKKYQDNVTRTHYSFENNIFKRRTEILDVETVKNREHNLGQMKMFLSGSNYKLQYHFPRRIKKVSNEKALFSQDGKSFVLEVGFIEFMENPNVFDIIVELEE